MVSLADSLERVHSERMKVLPQLLEGAQGWNAWPRSWLNVEYSLRDLDLVRFCWILFDGICSASQIVDSGLS
jgi:hypothetical protein